MWRRLARTDLIKTSQTTKNHMADLPAAESQPVDTDQSGSHRYQRLVLGQLTGNNGPAPGGLEERRSGDERRSGILRAFLYGNLRPRRRDGRRTEDHHSIIVDWHEPRVLYLALGILLMSCADALFTLNLLSLGAREANVLMERLISQDIDKFLSVKIGLTGGSVILLVIGVRRHFMGRFQVLHLMQVICLGYAVLLIYELYLFSQIIGVGSANERLIWQALLG